jgi:hypothetical protein
MLKVGTSLDKSQKMFYSQHDILHSQKMSGMDGWSYADEIFTGLEEGQFRIIPEKEDHSLIWILWHISRIEDVTMNVLVAGGSQLYLQDQWKRKLASPIDHVGNLVNPRDLLDLTRDVDLKNLFDYRDAVGRQTRHIVRDLELEELSQKVQPDRLVRLINEGAVLPEAEGLLDYWKKRKIFEMLLMPPTRHLMTHLNEAYSLVRILHK